MSLFFLFLALLLALEFLLRSKEKERRIQHMLGIRREPFSNRLALWIGQWPWFKNGSYALTFLAWRFEGEPENIGALLMLWLAGLSALLFFILLFLKTNLVKAVCILIAAWLFSAFFLFMLYHRGRERFEAALPRVYRLLSSRYLVCGDMVQSIEGILPELAGGEKKLFEQVLKNLRHNDLERRHAVFLSMMRSVRIEYFTLLMYIILQACEKGGRATILEQFVDLTEDCLRRMQTLKEMRQIAHAYQILFVILGGVYLLIPRLNQSLALDGTGMMSSAAQSGISYAFFLLLGFSCFLLSYMERSF